MEKFRQPSDYIKKADINAAHGISLVTDRSGSETYVRKDLHIYNPALFHFLFNNHIPGTPRIIDLCENSDTLTVIEEYIDGSTLSQLIDCGGINDFRSVLNILCDLCDILSALHAQDPPVIHRDIKPSNIMISNDGRVYLLDFNAAKFFDSEAEKDTVLLGTQGYAAPEQYGFASSTPQTDIYAMGVLLKNISGHFPDDQTLCCRHIWEKCTHMDPNDRYDSASELKKDLLSPKAPSSGKKKHCIRFLPPGFRTLTPWKMLIAVPVYALLVFMVSTMVITNVNSPARIILYKITFAAICLTLICVPCNYLNVQHIMPLCRKHSLPLRILGAAILLILFILVIFLIFAAADHFII